MAVRNIKSGSEVDQSGSEKKTVQRLGKTNADFWGKRLTKRAYEWDGKTQVVPDYQVRIAHLGRREFFNLATANRDAAAIKARNIYLSLVGEGWDATLAKYKPDMLVSKDCATVGEYLDAVKATSELRTLTFETYARKFRTLVSETFGIKSDDSKYDYVHGGLQRWMDRVHRIRLDRIKDKKVDNWKVRRLKAAEAENPLAYKRAKITLNSIIRGSKCLFTSEIIESLKGVKLPSPLPLEGVKNVSVERSKYRSAFDPKALLVAARRELKETSPEQYKAFLLAVGVGLRRKEIDSLTWKQIDWERHFITVETSIYAGTKSTDSEASVDVDPGLLAELKAYMGPGAGEFVIQSIVAPRKTPGRSHHYRCNRVFKRLNAWMRAKGVDMDRVWKPTHALRAEYGSLLNAQYGIYVASSALRHADIQTTKNHYTDKKVTAVLKFEDLIGEKEKEGKRGGE